jgi:hypothetical protein
MEILTTRTRPTMHKRMALSQRRVAISYNKTMTSVNELNAYNRGKREGYDIGHTAGTTETYRQAMSLRWMKIAIAILIGFALGMATEAHAQTATTSLTVVIPVQVTAEVACNPTNCPELPQEQSAQVQNIEEDKTLLQRIWSAILKALT